MFSPHTSLSILTADGSVMSRYVPVRNLIFTPLATALRMPGSISFTPVTLVNEVIMSMRSAPDIASFRGSSRGASYPVNTLESEITARDCPIPINILHRAFPAGGYPVPPP